jgi:S-adenosylmethionine/arginine decarboxylase-like enzyme
MKTVLAKLDMVSVDFFIDEREIVERLFQLIEKSRLHVRSSDVFYFHGVGALSVNVILSESNISLHTWPEKRTICIDLFCCTDEFDEGHISDYIYYINETFGPRKLRCKIIDRETNMEAMPGAFDRG